MILTRQNQRKNAIKEFMSLLLCFVNALGNEIKIHAEKAKL
jgi:hypothetical protein